MDKRNLYQVSTLTQFQDKGYDGIVPIKEMLGYGDTGFGTYHTLNGEMIVLDGIAYRALGDCTITVAEESDTTPFAVLGVLDARESILLEINGDLSMLMQKMSKLTACFEKPVLAHITGFFPEIVLHSVWPVKKPYAELEQVVRTQGVYRFKGIQGRLVGIFCPQWAVGMNVVGWHFHFLSDDLHVGGHVNELSAESLRVAFSIKDKLLMISSS